VIIREKKSGCLYKNGQILDNHEVIKSDTGLFAYVTLPTDEALDEEHNNDYVNEYLEKLRKYYDLSMSVLGENLNQGDSCCCKDPSWYLLFTRWTDNDSPVLCGDCGDSVPLYKLPHIYDKEHIHVTHWQKDYASIDRLFMHCLSDRFTYRQMHDPKSQLSERGREICQDFQEKMGKPFYYYLFNYLRYSKTCPVCGSDWRVEDENSIVDFKCDTCMLAADEV